MALKYAGIEVEHREIQLRSKPQSMLRISPKGTVPVLCVGDQILEQSLDIIDWALDQADPDGWRLADESISQAWVDKNDGPFKKLLDQYKYLERHPELNQEEVLAQAMDLMLVPMETALKSTEYLMGEKMSWVDVAIFPFIRQFAMADLEKFNDLPLPALRRWLNQHLESDLFLAVMHKYPVWIDE
jgi:glutathione S-transferase